MEKKSDWRGKLDIEKKSDWRGKLDLELKSDWRGKLDWTKVRLEKNPDWGVNSDFE